MGQLYDNAKDEIIKALYIASTTGCFFFFLATVIVTIFIE